MNARRFQFVWWWSRWRISHDGPLPGGSGKWSGCIYSDRWQIGPLEIRKWAGRSKEVKEFARALNAYRVKGER